MTNFILVFSLFKKVNYDLLKFICLILVYQPNKIFFFQKNKLLKDSSYSWIIGNILFATKEMSDQNILVSIVNPEVFYHKKTKADFYYSFDRNLISNLRKKYPIKTSIDFIKTNYIRVYSFPLLILSQSSFSHKLKLT